VILVDTSVWIHVYRDKSGVQGARLRELTQDEGVVLTRFNQLELLQGSRDDAEWRLLKAYLETQDYLEILPAQWEASARIYFDLRRVGKTVRSPIDCCIALLAIEHGLLLLHRDSDFESIAEVRPLFQSWFGERAESP
jgi:predicted nucleic acid-binding protein